MLPSDTNEHKHDFAANDFRHLFLNRVLACLANLSQTGRYSIYLSWRDGRL